MSFVMSTSFFTEKKLAFPLEGKRLINSAFEFSKTLRYLRIYGDTLGYMEIIT